MSLAGIEHRFAGRGAKRINMVGGVHQPREWRLRKSLRQQ
jgi:hypothetical protein